MILVLWLARLLDRTSHYARRAANVVYRLYYRRENRRARRESEQLAIANLIAETGGDRWRTVRRMRVGSPIHRDR